jgi:Flp pilus assembly protein TadG
MQLVHMCVRALAGHTRKFASEVGGNVAIVFALATIPLLAAAGSAIDYGHANAAKTDLQAAIDSTALMLSKEARNLSKAEIQQKAHDYFVALFPRPEATGITIKAQYSSAGGSTVIVDGSAQIPTDFVGVIGVDKITINGSSTIKWGSDRLRVALALDNTGSMSSNGKMDALKTATKNLLGQLKGVATVNGDVYVSIIPFAKDVNADSANQNKKWIDWTDWDAANGTCKNYAGSKEPKNENSCKAADGKWKSADHKTWNGCVTDRGGSTAPSALNTDTDVSKTDKKKPETLYPAEQHDACPRAASGLSYDWPSMTNLVDAMSPNGNTNQAIGLVWGWLSLAGGGPFDVPKMDSDYNYKQIIILLTDGLNTEDRWYSQQSSVDAREQITCDNIKAAKITLYTIQVNTTGDPTSSLLQNCASSADKFFLLTNANDMVATFEAIGTNITKLRVAK